MSFGSVTVSTSGVSVDDSGISGRDEVNGLSEQWSSVVNGW